MQTIKVFLAQESKGKIGGGWTFVDNLKKSTPRLVITDNIEESEVVLIPSATMLTRKYLKEIREKYKDKPFVLRIDNLPPDHRNSGKGWARLLACALASDHMIFQSEWAKNHIYPQLVPHTGEKSHSIVYNGVDTKIFTPDGDTYLDKEIELLFGQHRKMRDLSPRFLFFLSSSDPAKRIEEVVHLFREYSAYSRENGTGDPLLVLAGKGYPKEWVDYDFEFRNDENILYIPQPFVDKKAVASLYRSCDALIFTAYGNACSNTVLEAMACGLNVLYQAYGGQHELISPFGVPINYVDMGGIEMMSAVAQLGNHEHIRAKVESEYTLANMGGAYARVFEKVLKYKK